jgi:hypothetical protein
MKTLLKLFKRIISFIFKSKFFTHGENGTNIIYIDVGDNVNIFINPNPPTKNDRLDDWHSKDGHF